MSNIKAAKEFAKQLHKGHKRLSGENYAKHTFRVYKKLKKHNIREETTLVAALLHHALNFSTEVEKEIQRNFGTEVLEIAQGYKKVSNIKIEADSPSKFNEKYIMQAYINLSQDIRTLIIRLADKTDNLEHSWALPKEKRVYNAEKALFLYSPLARIIGMSTLAIELENEAFKILNPAEYYNINRPLEKRILQYETTIEEIERFLKSLLKESGIKKAKIQSRIKHVYGIYRKLNYQKTVKNIQNYRDIHDIVAMRIIVETIEECYLVENFLKDLWEYPLSERNDYIENPRPSGYRSIHNEFKIARGLMAEIQIRTFDMHEQSEYGPAAHLLYKIGEKGQESKAVEEFRKYLKTAPYWFRELNFWKAEKAISKYKPETPFSKNIYAFTPKKDIVELPKGATPLDFAYEIHSELGHGCVGAFVNGKIVKLDQEIETGDLVEIRVSKSKKKPSRDWLKIVKTKKARDAIKKALED